MGKYRYKGDNKKERGISMNTQVAIDIADMSPVEIYAHAEEGLLKSVAAASFKEGGKNAWMLKLMKGFAEEWAKGSPAIYHLHEDVTTSGCTSMLCVETLPNPYVVELAVASMEQTLRSMEKRIKKLICNKERLSDKVVGQVISTDLVTVKDISRDYFELLQKEEQKPRVIDLIERHMRILEALSLYNNTLIKKACRIGLGRLILLLLECLPQGKASRILALHLAA